MAVTGAVISIGTFTARGHPPAADDEAMMRMVVEVVDRIPMPVCLSACLPACLPACPPAWISVRLWLSVVGLWLSVGLYVVHLCGQSLREASAVPIIASSSSCARAATAAVLVQWVWKLAPTAQLHLFHQGTVWTTNEKAARASRQPQRVQFGSHRS